MSRMRESYDFIIVGACRAGMTAAQKIRENRPEAEILVINGEDRPPYKRTDLTKNLVSGFSREEFTLYSREWFEENRIHILADRVKSIDPVLKTLETRDGFLSAWGSLLLATGAVPVVPSIGGSRWLTHLRSAADAEVIRKILSGSTRVIVLGQGVEGVELAEQCRLMGLDVVITGRDDRLMKRWLDEEQSGRLHRLFESKGIEVHYSQRIQEVRKEGSLCRLICREQVLTGDIVLSSTGIVGNPELAEDLGVYGTTGILTDSFCETIHPGIFAAGDAVQLPPGWPRGLWHWAEYQGGVAALNMCGIRTELVNTPTRLKCEPFGEFYYSMSVQSVVESDRSMVFRNDPDLYLRLFSRDGRSIAALMTGLGKTESKILDRGIKSGISPETLYKSVTEGNTGP